MTKSEIHTNVTWTDLFFLLMLIIKVVATMIVVLMYMYKKRFKFKCETVIDNRETFSLYRTKSW